MKLYLVIKTDYKYGAENQKTSIVGINIVATW